MSAIQFLLVLPCQDKRVYLKMVRLHKQVKEAALDRMCGLHKRPSQHAVTSLQVTPSLVRRCASSPAIHEAYAVDKTVYLQVALPKCQFLCLAQ